MGKTELPAPVGRPWHVPWRCCPWRPLDQKPSGVWSSYSWPAKRNVWSCLLRVTVRDCAEQSQACPTLGVSVLFRCAVSSARFETVLQLIFSQCSFVRCVLHYAMLPHNLCEAVYLPATCILRARSSPPDVPLPREGRHRVRT